MNEIPSAGEVFRGDDGTVSTVLPSNYGQDYEASEGELDEYAEYIGIDVAKEPELMWIAKEGLRASLPDGWRACQTDENEVYYFNFQTGESLWDHPMDEYYKTQVTNERSKGRGGGGGAGAGGGAAETMPLRTAPVSATVGATKAIAESFFLKPSATASLTRLPGSLPNASVSSTLLASPTASEGASLPRAAPDVSDILGLAGNRGPPTSTTAASGVARFKESEAALRKRLEEENGLQLRNLRIELGKKADAERQRLAEAKTKLQSDLDHSWEAEKAGGGPTSPASSSAGGATGTATQRRLQLAREVKQIEESWKKRLHDVSTRVRELQQSLEAKQQSMQCTLQQTPEDLRKTLEARNAAGLAQLREAKKKESEVALSQRKSEHALALTEARRRANDAVAAAEKAGEAELEKKSQERRAQNAAMLAALQTALTAKQAKLAEQEQAAAAAAAASSASTGPPPSPNSPAAPPSKEDEAAVVAAQTAADADVAEAKRASAAETARLREEYAAKKAEAEAALRAAQQQQQQQQQLPIPRPLSRTSTLNSATTSPTSGAPTPRSGGGGGSAFSGSLGTISPADQAKLDEEDRKLRDEAERAARVFEEETQLMVANKKAGRPLAAVPPPDVAATVSAEAIASLSRSAAQEQRTRDTENTRHAMAMKQLETKHEQAVRAIKAAHDKALAAAPTPRSDGAASGSAAVAGFNPRQHPSFNTQLTARKQAWLRENPAPKVDLPKLPPVPTLPAATMQSDMGAVQVLDEAEQARLIKSRLAQVREELHRQYDDEAKALQKARETGLAELKASYRATRLAEVEKAVAALRVGAAAAAAASQKAVAENALAQSQAQRAKSAAMATAEATRAAEASRLEALQTQRSTLESSVAEADTAHEWQTQATQARIAALEASLAELRAQEQREETTKARLLRQQQQQQQEQEQGGKQHRQAADTRVPAGDPAAASFDSDLYIADAEAAAEEAALRARWSTLLTALRNAVRREMEAYERALEDSSGTAAPTAATAARAPSGAVPRAAVLGSSVSTPRERGTSIGGGGGLASLPPTAPPAAAVATAAMMTPGHGVAPQLALHPSLQGVGGSMSGFTTPLQRPPREDGAMGLAMPMGGAAGAFSGPGARQVSGSPGPQVYLSDSPRLGPAAAAAAGVGASAMPVRRALLAPFPQPQLWPSAAAAAQGRHFDPYQRAGVPPGPGRSAMPAAGLRGGVDDAEEAASRRHATHLSALQQTIRARRRELQAQRVEMEALREEWRTDMSACKQHGDRAQAQQLRAVKSELEVRARKLNEEVLQLKEMQERLHEEVQHFRQWSQLRHPQVGVPPDEVSRQRSAGGGALTEAGTGSRGWGGAETSSASLYASRADVTSNTHGGGPADVMSLLQSVMDRTERLEEMLLLSRVSPHPSPSPPAP